MSRRWVARNLGRGGLAVVVLGLNACSDGSDGGTGDAAASRTPSTGTPTTGTPTTGTPTTGTATGNAAGPDATGTLSWDRVDLGFVSAYVLVRGDQAAVVDTGVSGSADAIGAVLDRAGPGWAGVRHVILTHHHPDHAGSAAEVLTRAATAAGYVGEADLPLVTGPRLRPVADGAEVFGLQIVGTPGHTPGHLSVFDPQTGVLVAGDALNNSAGLTGSSPQFTDDPDAAKASVRRLAALPVKTVLFGHGDPLQAGAAQALAMLAAR